MLVFKFIMLAKGAHDHWFHLKAKQWRRKGPHTPAKKVLGHLWLPLLRLLLWRFSSEALSISPSVLINEIRFVGKSMPRIINFNNLQWVLKYLIICTHSRNNRLHRNKLVTKLVFSYQLAIRSKCNSDNKPCAFYKVWYTTKLPVPWGFFWKYSLLSKLTLYLPQDENMVMHIFDSLRWYFSRKVM